MEKGKKKKFRSGEALIDQALGFLEGEGFMHESVQETYPFRLVALSHPATDEIAVVVYSTLGYPALSQGGYLLKEPEILRAPAHDIEPPHPLSLARYVREQQAKKAGGPKPPQP
jgi:hypothetical protein